MRLLHKKWCACHGGDDDDDDWARAAAIGRSGQVWLGLKQPRFRLCSPDSTWSDFSALKRLEVLKLQFSNTIALKITFNVVYNISNYTILYLFYNHKNYCIFELWIHNEFSVCSAFPSAHSTVLVSEQGDVRHTVSVVLFVLPLKNCWPSGCLQGKWRQFVLSSFLQLSFCAFPRFFFSSQPSWLHFHGYIYIYNMCVCVWSSLSFLLLSHLQVYPMYYAYPVTLHFCCALVKCATVGKWRSQKHLKPRRELSGPGHSFRAHSHTQTHTHTQNWPRTRKRRAKYVVFLASVLLCSRSRWLTN